MQSDLSAGPIQYVVKRVLTPLMFERAKALKDTFGENPLLRTHIDCNEEEQTLVYEYFKADVLALVSNEPALPLSARKKILHEIARAIDAMHSKGWIHLGRGRDSLLYRILADYCLSSRCEAK